MYGPCSGEITWLLLMVFVCSPEKLEKRSGTAVESLSSRLVPVCPNTARVSSCPARSRRTGHPTPRRGAGAQPHARRVSSSRWGTVCLSTTGDYCGWGRCAGRLREMETANQRILRRIIILGTQVPEDRVNTGSARWVGRRESSYVISPAVTVHHPPRPTIVPDDLILVVRKRRPRSQHVRSRAVTMHQPELVTKCVGDTWKRSEGCFPRVIALTLSTLENAYAIYHAHDIPPSLYPRADCIGNGRSRGGGAVHPGLCGDLIERCGGSQSKGAGGGGSTWRGVAPRRGLVNLHTTTCYGNPDFFPARHPHTDHSRDSGGPSSSLRTKHKAMKREGEAGPDTLHLHEERDPPGRAWEPERVESIQALLRAMADVGTPRRCHDSEGWGAVVIMKQPILPVSVALP